MSRLAITPPRLSEDDLLRALDDLVEIVEIVCSCGDPTHARHQLRPRLAGGRAETVEGD